MDVDEWRGVRRNGKVGDVPGWTDDVTVWGGEGGRLGMYEEEFGAEVEWG